MALKLKGAFLLWLALQPMWLKAQQFISPLEVPIELSGNFGELRSNHFHTGLDIRTGGRTGLKVVSIADGYVSRVRVSERGYGRAVYITHPGGKVSVYAHLQSFSDSIEQFVKRQQYAEKSFSIDVHPEPFLYTVKQGELIGLSGNSGSSGGPHLHFEIRNQYTENPLNPLNHGYTIPDHFRPVFEAVTFHPIDSRSAIKGSPSPLTIPVIGRPPTFSLSSGKVHVSGIAGISVKTLDRTDLPGYTVGLYILKVRAHGRIIFEARFDSLSFFENRAINAYIDYGHFCGTGEKYQKTWLPKANKLFNLKADSTNGLIQCQPGDSIPIEIEATDYSGNRSVLSFTMIGTSLLPGAARIESASPKMMRPGEMFVFHERDIWLQAAPDALYDEQEFLYQVLDTFPDGTARRHQVLDACIPLHRPIQLMVKVPEQYRQNKNLVLLRMKGDKTESAYDGLLTGGMFHTEVEAFGTFMLQPDVQPPVITLLSTTPQLQFRVEDALSGIVRYELYVDDSWFLSEYDPRIKKISAGLSDAGPGEHSYTLMVFDKAGNMAKKSGTFRR